MRVFDKLNNLADSLYNSVVELVDYMKFGYKSRPRAFGGEGLAAACALAIGTPLAATGYVGELGLVPYIIGAALTAIGTIAILDDIFFTSAICAYTIGVPKEEYLNMLK